jgi:hypothetical protein
VFAERLHEGQDALLRRSTSTPRWPAKVPPGRLRPRLVRKFQRTQPQTGRSNGSHDSET